MSNRLSKKLALVAALIGVVLLAWALNLEQYLTLSYVKASREQLVAVYTAHRALVIAGYMGIYIVVTAFSLPGAAVMTLAGGGLFGLIVGTVVVSFSSTIGASLAFLLSRFLLGDWVQRRFGDKLVAMNEGIEREGAFYLFAMRLVPIFPFFVINLLMGLTKMPVDTFFLVSQLGMLPGTVVYVNAGKELSRIDSLSGILSPGVIFSFALLGLLPIVTKKLLTLYRARSGGSPG